MEKLTVVIPVFNTKSTLNKCFKSLTGQTYRKFKVIIVDDGSTDGSLELSREWEKKDSRFQVITNSSGIHGASRSRNIGLSMVSTEWVTFIDSDDWVEANHFSLLMSHDKYDICVSGWERGESVSRKELHSEKYQILDRTQCIIKALGMKEFSGYLWNKVFRMDIIRENNLKLDTGVSTSEDLLFVLTYLRFIKSGFLVSEPRTYHYVIREDSITQRLNKNNKELFSELHAVDKSERILDMTNLSIKNAFLAHKVKTYQNLFWEIHSRNTQKYRRLESMLRYNMLLSCVRYLCSNEFTLNSKGSLLFAIVAPDLKRMFKKKRR